jgi:hypothetical protein
MSLLAGVLAHGAAHAGPFLTASQDGTRMTVRTREAALLRSVVLPAIICATWPARQEA